MGFNESSNNEASFGYVNMVRTFMRAGVQPPSIPKSLWPKIFAQENWCWGTQPVDSFGMYLMWDYTTSRKLCCDLSRWPWDQFLWTAIRDWVWTINGGSAELFWWGV